MTIDQVKAFDRVEWDYLYRTLEKFGYGQNFINIIKTLYKNIQSKIKMNGYISTPFNLKRGVRQGCPISMPLYVLGAEIFAIYIRNRRNIKGIKLNTQEYKICQFADDTTFFLVGTNSLNQLTEAIQLYETASGAKLNPSKCEGLWMGAYKNNNMSPLGYKWGNKKIKILGITFGNPGISTDLDNWENKIQKILKSIHLWSNLKLSYKGKRLVINQLFLSKLWYVAHILPIPKNIINQLEYEITKFLWSNKKIHTNKRTIHLPIIEGGLQITNIKSQVEALHLTWISKALNKTVEGAWKEFFLYNLNKIHKNNQSLHNLFTYINKPKLCVHNKLPPFYKNLIAAWVDLGSNDREPPSSLEGILNEPLFENKFIVKNNYKSNNKPSLPKTPKWAKAEIITVADICHIFKPGFVSHEMLCKITETDIPEQEYYNILKTIPTSWKNIINTQTQTFDHHKYLHT